MPPLNTTPQKGRDWTREQIFEALHRAGWSLRRLALHHEVNPSTFQAVIYRPYPRAELRVAEALGVTPQEIWPSRYDADGQPNRPMGRPKVLPRVIPNLRKANRSTGLQQGNVQRRKAA